MIGERGTFSRREREVNILGRTCTVCCWVSQFNTGRGSMNRVDTNGDESLRGIDETRINRLIVYVVSSSRVEFTERSCSLRWIVNFFRCIFHLFLFFPPRRRTPRVSTFQRNREACGMYASRGELKLNRTCFKRDRDASHSKAPLLAILVSARVFNVSNVSGVSWCFSPSFCFFSTSVYMCVCMHGQYYCDFWRHNLYIVRRKDREESRCS